MFQANRLLAGLALAALVVLSLDRASAGGDAAQRAADISSRTMSPFCPGRTLSSCPSPAAAEWRRDIRQWVDEGLSTEEIRARLEQRVPGENLSGAPGSPGGWLLPVALATASALVLFVVLRRLRGSARRAEMPSDAAAGQSDIDRRLEEELARLDD